MREEFSHCRQNRYYGIWITGHVGLQQHDTKKWGPSVHVWTPQWQDPLTIATTANTAQSTWSGSPHNVNITSAVQYIDSWSAHTSVDFSARPRCRTAAVPLSDAHPARLPVSKSLRPISFSITTTIAWRARPLLGWALCNPTLNVINDGIDSVWPDIGTRADRRDSALNRYSPLGL